jgi:hypothetical protein
VREDARGEVMAGVGEDSAAPQRAEPAWKKASRPSREARRRMAARRKAAKAKVDARISPLQARWLGEVLTNGGNVAAAARSVGVSAATAKHWLAKGVVREAFDRVAEAVEERVRDWSSVMGRAQGTLLSLLDSEDDRVRLQVATYLVDRVLGKTAQKLEATVTRRDALGEVELEAAVSLVALRGLTLSEATAYVRSHPGEVEAWAASQLRSGRAAELVASPPAPPLLPERGDESGITQA